MTAKPEKYGRHWRIVMADGRSLFDRASNYPRIFSRKRDAESFLLEHPEPKQPEFPEGRATINWGASVDKLEGESLS